MIINNIHDKEEQSEVLRRGEYSLIENNQHNKQAVYKDNKRILYHDMLAKNITSVPKFRIKKEKIQEGFHLLCNKAIKHIYVKRKYIEAVSLSYYAYCAMIK